jgi:cyclopropane fatty-acyl-phospholipid synthase-like methyltransferase
MADSKELWLSIRTKLPDNRIVLGPAYSELYRTDPRALSFGAARYKFVSKMLAGLTNVFEVGCGDAFGAPIVGQSVEKLVCTDIDEHQLADNRKRLEAVTKVSFEYHDFRLSPLKGAFDGGFLLDVFEHIYPAEGDSFLTNVSESLPANGELVVGVPNKAAAAYASPRSQEGHVNLMTSDELKRSLSKHWQRVLMFGMNDEVVHTGYAAMCHYIIALCTMKR